MNPLVKQTHYIPRTLTLYSRLLDHCCSSKSVNLTRVVHGQLIKAGLNSHTFLGNRCLELYTRCHLLDDILKAFGDITCKNTVSWNVCFKGLLNCGRTEMAQSLFQRMPERDVVSWNSLISWHASCGHSDAVWDSFREMLCKGVKPSGYTYSIVVCLVYDALLGKELHGRMIRSGLIRSSVVLGNSLIDMYSKMGLIDYAIGVFSTMEYLDLISWNSLIMGCCKAGYCELALDHFSSMRYLGFPPDEFTCSAVITCCTILRNLEMGKQIFALCIKVGLLCNSIISGAIIDLFAKCNRLEHSVQLFRELDRHDSATCNSMISIYTTRDSFESAIQLLVVMLREGVMPTEFTLSSILASVCVVQVVPGTLVHSLAVKIGFEIDFIVSSSLVHMYATLGLIDCALKIFASMALRDLISWNIMIMGLALNGRFVEAIDTFNELHIKGPMPDLISITGVLRACSLGGFVDEGTAIFSKMEKYYGVKPCYEHYACLVNMLCQDGRLYDAMKIIELMPYEPNSTIWESLLHECTIHGNVRLAEKVAVRLMELEPQLSLPYVVLGCIYQIRGQWEDAVRVREAMKRNVVMNVIGYSWIVIQNHVYSFTAEQLQHHAGRDIYSILRLLTWDKGETISVEVNQADIDAIANMFLAF